MGTGQRMVLTEVGRVCWEAATILARDIFQVSGKLFQKADLVRCGGEMGRTGLWGGGRSAEKTGPRKVEFVLGVLTEYEENRAVGVKMENGPSIVLFIGVAFGIFHFQIFQYSVMLQIGWKYRHSERLR